jgi:flagellar hook-length control protein FliK
MAEITPNPEDLARQAAEQAEAAARALAEQAKAAAAAAEALAREKIEKAKAAAEKLKALKDKLKKKKAAPPAFPPVQKFEPKPLPKEEIVKFKDAPPPPPPPEQPLDRVGYTYVVKTMGPKNSIVVYNNTTEIFKGYPSFTASVDILLEEALAWLIDANDGSQFLYPNIRNLIRRVDR